MDNMFVHLTNVAIQQYSDKYSNKHGGKWSIDCIKFYVESVYGSEAYAKMIDDMNSIFLTSLKVFFFKCFLIKWFVVSLSCNHKW